MPLLHPRELMIEERLGRGLCRQRALDIQVAWVQVLLLAGQPPRLLLACLAGDQLDVAVLRTTWPGRCLVIPPRRADIGRTGPAAAQGDVMSTDQKAEGTDRPAQDNQSAGDFAGALDLLLGAER
jgi:hypothetical protein